MHDSQFVYGSKNLRLTPLSELHVPLTSLEVVYGFGVYETIRVSRRMPRFLDEHIARLLESACIIHLEHQFSDSETARAITELIEATGQHTYNLKVLLYGGATSHDASLYIMPSNPYFPSDALYRDGVKVITAEAERPFPHAKSLNMLPSYLAYKKAQKQGAYDALLINRRGEVTEGTRTNVFALSGTTLISPPSADILLGVTRSHVIDIAQKNGYTYLERTIMREELTTFDALFLTSTSTKIMPIKTLDELPLPQIPETLRALVRAFDALNRALDSE